MYYSSNDKGYDTMSKFPPETPLAMAYVPWQNYGETYPENTALQYGTIFPDLYFPVTFKEVMNNGK